MLNKNAQIYRPYATQFLNSAQFPLLLLVGYRSQERLEAIAHSTAPRLDYQMVADVYKGIVIECTPSPSGLSGSRTMRIVRSMSGNVKCATQLIRSVQPKTVVYTTGETWGLPVAFVSGLLRRRFVHVMYVHRLYSPKWLQFLCYMGRFLHVDGWICVNKYQAALLRSVLPKSADRVTVVSQTVDTQFYDPLKVHESDQSPYILSVGAEMRNYTVFFDAVRNLNIPVVLKASSAWMAQMRDAPRDMPSNVTLIDRRLSYVELRDLYGGASLVVVPLYDTPQAAGMTTILEAMSMAKPVVVTQSRGLPDGLISGENCLVVDPNPAQLGEAIVRLLGEPETMMNIAQAGQNFARENYSLERYAYGVATFLKGCAGL